MPTFTDEIEKFEYLQKGTTWKGRAIYHCTLTVAEHACLLGQIVVPRETDSERAYIHRLPLGQAVVDCFFQIRDHHPEIKLFPQKLMPNHFHFIVEVQRTMPVGIRKVLQGFQQGCKAAARQLATEGRLLEGAIGSNDFCTVFPSVVSVDNIHEQGKTVLGNNSCYGLPLSEDSILLNGESLLTLETDPATIGGKIFPERVFPRIMSHHNQLPTSIAYVEDNVVRKAYSLMYPGAFRVQHDVLIAGRRYAAVGNLLLLQEPRRQTIHVHKEWVWDAERHGNDKPLRDYKNRCVLEARKGGMLSVSPCINEHEAQVRDVLLAEGWPMAIIMDNGFRPFYTPPTEWCKPLAEGRLLLLAPWPYVENKPTILRQEAVTLNGYADEIVAER